MKKLMKLFTAALFVGSVALTSCSKDDPADTYPPEIGIPEPPVHLPVEDQPIIDPR